MSGFMAWFSTRQAQLWLGLLWAVNAVVAVVRDYEFYAGLSIGLTVLYLLIWGSRR